MAHTSQSTTQEKKPTTSNSPRMSTAWKIIATLFFSGIVLQHILGGEITGAGGQRIAFVIFGLLVFLATVAMGLNASWRRFLSSNSFAVPVIIALSVLAALGTMILQGQSRQVMDRYYGSSSSIIQAFFLNDLFHSLGFVAVLCVGAGGLALTVCRKRRLTARYLGSVGAHLGLLLMLAGAAMGNVWVLKGRLELRRGQMKDHFLIDTPDGSAAKVPLGFSVRLDDFHLDMYEPEYSLLVVDMTGRDEKVLCKTDPRSPDEDALAALGIEIKGFWPDHATRLNITRAMGRTAPSEQQPAAIHLQIAAGNSLQDKWLFAFDGSKPMREVMAGSALAFCWNQKQARSMLETQSSPSGPHLLQVDDKSFTIQMGKQLQLPGHVKVKLLRFLPDFVVDSSTGQLHTRSMKPNNPAVQLEVWKEQNGDEKKHTTTWLFDRFPNFHHQGQETPLKGVRYRYVTGSDSQSSLSAVAVGEIGRLWKLRQGSIQQELPLEKGSEFTLGIAKVKVLAFYPSANVEQEDFSRSDRQSNPLVRIKRTDKPGTADLTINRPIRLKNGHAIVLTPTKGEMVRDYVSTLSVWENKDGKLQRVEQKKIEVNYPLEHNGYYFYQADYRPDDPDWSGFQVTRDSGLFFVYLGFSMNLLGVLMAVFSPVFIRRKKIPLKGIP